jgi:serine/threonine-protein kinase
MAPTRQFGKYVLLGRIGSGGMAEVWRAQAANEERPSQIALKRIQPVLAADERFRQMFETEARLSLLLRHPGLVRVYEHGEVKGLPYLAMELVEGQSLAEVIRAQRERSLPSVDLAVFVVSEVGRALDHVHSLAGPDGTPLGLVHRDVSPGNVLISNNGAVKLCDFGVAKAFYARERAQDRTETGVIKGKVPYIAPEQLAGQAVDHRADLFSVGVLLHEALTGHRLFDERCPRPERIPAPSSFRSGVPPLLDEVCARLLAPDREERFATARELVHTLAPLVAESGFDGGRVASVMAALFGRPGPEATAATRAPSRPWPFRWIWRIGAGVTLMIGLLTLAWFRRPPQAAATQGRERERPLARPTASSPVPSVDPPGQATIPSAPSLDGVVTHRQVENRTKRSPPAPSRAGPAPARPRASSQSQPVRLDGADALGGGQMANPFSR